MKEFDRPIPEPPGHNLPWNEYVEFRRYGLASRFGTALYRHCARSYPEPLTKEVFNELWEKHRPGNPAFAFDHQYFMDNVVRSILGLDDAELQEAEREADQFDYETAGDLLGQQSVFRHFQTWRNIHHVVRDILNDQAGGTPTTP